MSMRGITSTTIVSLIIGLGLGFIAKGFYDRAQQQRTYAEEKARGLEEEEWTRLSERLMTIEQTVMRVTDQRQQQDQRQLELIDNLRAVTRSIQEEQELQNQALEGLLRLTREK